MSRLSTVAWLAFTWMAATSPSWARDDLMTSRLVDEARQWEQKGRDELAAEIWRKILLTNPQHAQALGSLQAIELRDSSLRGPAPLASKPPVASQQRTPSGDNMTVQPTVGTNKKNASSTTQTPLGTSFPSAAIEVTIRDKPTASTSNSLAYLQSSSARGKRWGATRRSLENLVQTNPTEPKYALALARHLTFRQITRKEGIAQLAKLDSQGLAEKDIQALWRHAILRLPVDGQEQAFVAAYLERFPQDQFIGKRRHTTQPVERSAADLPLNPKLPQSPEKLETQALSLGPDSNSAKARQILQSIQSRSRVDSAESGQAARTALEQAMLLDPTNTAIRIALSEVYQGLGMQNEAASLLDNVLEVQPENPQALHASARLHAARAQWTQGLQMLERIPVTARTPEHATAQRSLWINAQTQRAQQLFDVGQFDQAKRVMEQAAEAANGDVQAETDVAVAWSTIGQGAKALGTMRRIMSATSPRSMEPKVRYAEILLNTQQDAELAALLQDIAATDRLSAVQQDEINRIILGYTLRVTESLRESGRLVEAADVIRPALYRYDDVRLLNSMARLYQAAGNYDAALELVERVVAREPRQIAHRLLAVDIALLANDLNKAQLHANAALDMEPEHPRVLTAVGRVESKRGNTANALMYFKQAQRLESQRGEAGLSDLSALRLVGETASQAGLLSVPAPASPAPRNGLLPIPPYSPGAVRPRGAGASPAPKAPSGAPVSDRWTPEQKDGLVVKVSPLVAILSRTAARGAGKKGEEYPC